MHPRHIATALLVLLAGAAILLPLGWMVAQLLAYPAIWQELRPTQFRLMLLGRTVAYNASSAVLATILAWPAAMVVGRGRGIVARVLIFALPLALVLPSISYTYGWLCFLDLARVDLIPGGWPDVLRCVWTLAAWLWPLPAVGIGLSLRALDSHVQQQALIDGGLWRVTFRSLLPAILAAMAIVFVLASQEFAVYERGGISVVATEVRTVFDVGSLSGGEPSAIIDVPGGSGLAREAQGRRAAAAIATALPLLGLIAALAAGAFILAARIARSAEGVEIGHWPRILDARPVNHVLAIATLAITLGVPVTAMLWTLGGRWDVARTIRWAMPEMAGSILYGAIAGAGALLLAVLAMVRRTRWLPIAALAMFLIGGELLAIANIRLYSRPAPWPLGLVRIDGRDPFGLIYNNIPIVALAHLGRFAWIGLLAGAITWSRPLRELRDLAAIDGAGPWRSAWTILPLAWPMLLAAAILVMVLSITEVPANLLLNPQRPRMFIPTLMQWIHILNDRSMIEGSLLLMAMVALAGLAAAILAWLALRLMGLWRRMMPLGLAMLFLLAGCGDSSKPDEVWCETGPGPGQLIYPRGIAYSARDDCFFVVDRTARIQRLDAKGQYVLHWRMPRWDFGKPVGLSVGPDGNVYVPDTHYSRVVVYSPEGKMLREWGSAGEGPGQFIYPTDVAFDSAGNVYVSEYGENDRVQVFDPQGRFLREFGQPGVGPTDLSRPESIAIAGDEIYIADSCNHRIQVFTLAGQHVRSIGECGSAPGQFRFPYGLDLDRDGKLVVTEFGNNRIQVIDPATGASLRAWGSGGREEGQLAYPWASAPDKRGRIVIVDAGNNRLQVIR